MVLNYDCEIATDMLDVVKYKAQLLFSSSSFVIINYSYFKYSQNRHFSIGNHMIIFENNSNNNIALHYLKKLKISVDIDLSYVNFGKYFHEAE